MSSCLWCQNEIDQIGERERGLWVVTIKVATAYCVCSGKLPSLHTLATYTQVKCPSMNKEIFIMRMVFFFIVQKIYKTTTLFQDIKSTLNWMCHIGALVYIVQCIYLVCKFLFWNYIKCYLHAHIYFLCQAYKIELTSVNIECLCWFLRGQRLYRLIEGVAFRLLYI